MSINNPRKDDSQEYHSHVCSWRANLCSLFSEVELLKIPWVVKNVNKY